MALASGRSIKNVSFPSISTGAYGYPIKLAAPIALVTAKDYLEDHPEIELVRFVLSGRSAHEAYKRTLGAPQAKGAS